MFWLNFFTRRKLPKGSFFIEKMTKGKTILAVGAHPDDIEYYAGGTLLKMSKDNQVYLIVATDGGLNGEAETRRLEQLKAAEVLGARETIFLGYPDLELERVKEELSLDLLKKVLELRPDIIFSFDPENQFRYHPDIHPDHRVLSLAMSDVVLLQSTLPAYIQKVGLNHQSLNFVPEIWLFDPKEPNHYEDISEEWNLKIRLLQVFLSQGLNIVKIEKQARKFGEFINKKEAEGFKIIDFNDNI